MPLNRLKYKLTKEVLWIYILKLLKERKMYGYELRRELEKNFGFKPALITSYVVLYKLEKMGYVKSGVIDKRRYYTITHEGIKLLDEGIWFIESILEKLKESEKEVHTTCD